MSDLVAWLVERNESTDPANDKWTFLAWTAEGWRFVESAMDALRFATKEDAETVVNNGNGWFGSTRICDHRWVDPETADFTDEEIALVREAVAKAREDSAEYRRKTRVPWQKMLRPITPPDRRHRPAAGEHSASPKPLESEK